MAATIETWQLTKNYHGRSALRAMDLAVPRDAVFGYLGPNARRVERCSSPPTTSTRSRPWPTWWRSCGEASSSWWKRSRSSRPRPYGPLGAGFRLAYLAMPAAAVFLAAALPVFARRDIAVAH
jgi:hypothetical protein